MSGTQTPNRTVYTHSTSPVGEDGVVRCHVHDAPAQRFVAQTEKNMGRAFYKCAIQGADGCSFWKWEDQLPGFATPQRPGFPPSTQTPRPSLAQRAQVARSPSVQISPSKRNRSVTPPATPPRAGPSRAQPGKTPSGKMTPAEKERRLREIQAGLSDTAATNALPLPGSSPSKRVRVDNDETNVNAAVEGLLASPTQYSDTSRYDVGLQAEPPSSQDVFWMGTNPGASSGVPGHAGTPSYRLRSLPPEDVVRGPGTPARAHGRSENGPLPTPPRTSQSAPRPSQQLSYGCTGPESPSRKGKGHAAEAGAPGSQKGKAQADVEGAFCERAESLRKGLQLVGSGGTEELSADMITSAVTLLGTVPDYVRKSERKQMALQKSIDARQKRINQLEARVAELEGHGGKIDQQDARIAQLESHNRLLLEENASLRIRRA